MQLHDVHPEKEVELGIFKCPTCQHELKLMVWRPLDDH
jgi:hypothetical protein